LILDKKKLYQTLIALMCQEINPLECHEGLSATSLKITDGNNHGHYPPKMLIQNLQLLPKHRCLNDAGEKGASTKITGISRMKCWQSGTSWSVPWHSEGVEI